MTDITSFDHSVTYTPNPDLSSDLQICNTEYVKSIGVAEGGSWGSEEPPLGGSNRARKRRSVLLAAYV